MTHIYAATNFSYLISEGAGIEVSGGSSSESNGKRKFYANDDIAPKSAGVKNYAEPSQNNDRLRISRHIQ